MFCRLDLSHANITNSEFTFCIIRKYRNFNDNVCSGVFNVALLRGASNPRAVYSSKAVGEPPLFLAASVFFAVKVSNKSINCPAQVNSSQNFIFKITIQFL